MRFAMVVVAVWVAAVVVMVHSGSDLLGSSEKAFSSVMLNKDCPGTHIHDQKDF